MENLGHPPPVGHPKRSMGAAGRVLVVLLALVGLGEVLCRIALTSPSAQVPDPELGWVWRPGATVFNGKEGRAPFVVNELGFNDGPIADPGPKTRILGLGNSFMEAYQVPREANYTSRVERETGIDVVNLGRSAMGPAHYPLVARRFAALEPDLLLVSLGRGDVERLLDAEATRRGGRIVDVRPTVPTTDRVKGLFTPILRRSALATHGTRQLKPWLLELGPQPELRERDLAEARARLRWILADLERIAPVVVLEVPELRYLPGGRVRTADPDERAVLRHAARGLPYVDAGPWLERAWARDGWPGHGFPRSEPGAGHLNEQGHAAVADALVAWLRAR